VELQLTTAKPSWFTGYLYPTEPHVDIKQTQVPASSSKKVLVRVPLSLAAVSVPLENYTSELIVRVKARDRATSEESAWTQSPSPISLKAKPPVVTDARMPRYIGGAGVSTADGFIKYTHVSITLAGTNGSTPSGSPVEYRMSRNLADLADGIVGGFQSWASTNTFTFNESDPNGTATMYVKAYDSNYNSSAAAVFTYDGDLDHLPYLQKDVPARGKARIVGTTGNEFYTGIRIDASGRFIPDRTAKLYISATSPLPMTFEILPISNVEPTANIDTQISYDSVTAVQDVKLTTRTSNFDQDHFNCDSSTTIAVNLWDAAGNRIALTASTRLNTRIYKTVHYPLDWPVTSISLRIRRTSDGLMIGIRACPSTRRALPLVSLATCGKKKTTTPCWMASTVIWPAWNASFTASSGTTLGTLIVMSRSSTVSAGTGAVPSPISPSFAAMGRSGGMWGEGTDRESVGESA